MKIRELIPWLGVGFSVLMVAVWRSESQQDSAAQEKVREIAIKADKARYNNKTGITTFIGNVVVTQVGEKFEMTAERVEYEEKTDSATATGNLVFRDPDTTITGDKIQAFFAEKKAIISGNVKLSSHGKSTGGEGEKQGESLREQYRKKKTTMTCDQIEYLYSEGKATATGNLRFAQEDKKGTAGKAIYLEEEEQILLEGDVEVVNEKGERLRCRRAIIYIKEDSIEAEGVEATLIRKEEKKTKGETATSGKAEGKSEGHTTSGEAPKPAGETETKGE